MEALRMQFQSGCILALIYFGVILIKRHQKSYHIKVMSLAMLWDILLILQIELSRSAILKASKALTNAMMLNIHVAIAITTVLLYALMIHSGRKILVGQVQAFRNRHKRLGYLTVFMRTLTFVTSFWAVIPKE